MANTTQNGSDMPQDQPEYETQDQPEYQPQEQPQEQPEYQPQYETGNNVPNEQPAEERPDGYGEMPTPAQPQSTTTSDNQTTPETEDAGYFGPRRKRIITVAAMLLWLCVFIFGHWSENVKSLGQKWVDAYKLHLAGTILIFLGLFVVLAVVTFEHRSNFFENRFVKFGFAGAFLLGGFLYWVGGIQLAKTINDSAAHSGKSVRYHVSGLAGTVFIEATFVALIVIALDVDIIFNYFSKNERLRIYYVFNTILAFTSLVAFFSYAAWRAYGTGLNQSTAGCVAAGWFFVLISCIYWYVIEFIDICCKCSASAQACVKEKSPTLKLAGVVILLFGAFLVMVGMWSLGTTSNKKTNAYYAGYGFFVFFYCSFLAFDIYLGKFIEQRRKQ